MACRDPQSSEQLSGLSRKITIYGQEIILVYIIQQKNESY